MFLNADCINNDCHIDRFELFDVLESISDDDYTEEDIITIMTEYDLDHNGTIEFHEFAHMVLTHNRFTMIRKALANIDREHRSYDSRKRRKSSLLSMDPEKVASNEEELQSRVGKFSFLYLFNSHFFRLALKH